MILVVHWIGWKDGMCWLKRIVTTPWRRLRFDLLDGKEFWVVLSFDAVLMGIIIWFFEFASNGQWKMMGPSFGPKDLQRPDLTSTSNLISYSMVQRSVLGIWVLWIWQLSWEPRILGSLSASFVSSWHQRINECFLPFLPLASRNQSHTSRPVTTVTIDNSTTHQTHDEPSAKSIQFSTRSFELPRLLNYVPSVQCKVFEPSSVPLFESYVYVQFLSHWQPWDPYSFE